MERIGRISLYLGMAMLLVGLAGTSIALPADDNLSGQSFVEQIFHSWRGFATNDQESHVLRMSVESVSLIEPMQIRELLGANASLEEMYDQIRKERGETISKGYLKLGKAMTGADSYGNTYPQGKQGIYDLVNMNITTSGSYTVIDADVAERGYSRQNGTARIVGHITVNAADYDPDQWAEMSEGQLTMDGGPFPGEYKVLLETQSLKSLTSPIMSDEGIAVGVDDVPLLYDPSMNASHSEGSS